MPKIKERHDPNIIRTSVGINKELHDWAVVQAQAENRSLSNYLNTLLLKARDEQKTLA